MKLLQAFLALIAFILFLSSIAAMVTVMVTLDAWFFRPVLISMTGCIIFTVLHEVVGN